MSNPDSYTLEDLKAVYPQFEGDGVPDSVLELYLELAHEAIQKIVGAAIGSWPWVFLWLIS